MTGRRLQRAREVFEKLVDVPPGQREPLLASACDGDEQLQTFVKELLANHDGGMGEFMVSPAFVSDSDPPFTDATRPPQRIGRYEIIRVIGEGGMGTVYEAQQENPRRCVALKVVRPGLMASHVLRRFQQEANLLGQLQHSGIAQIYEAGVAEVTSGVGPSARQPFFAMELIRGGTLTEYAQSARLRTRERLELLARVCDAVQHAHQNGVIHRDLKPANVLVDENGQPKILDFGVARLTDADVQTVTTQTGVGQLIGTVPYMSPEQVSGDSRQLDTRSDVYSLGVILFELLSGKLPHDVRTTSIPEAVRKIRDDLPVRLASLDRSFRGEIEIIVSKALEKEKPRRYQTASDLAADIRRYLRGDAIEARRDSALYVLRKAVRRYRGIALAGALLLVLLTTFGVVSFVQAEKNRRLAADERQARENAVAALKLARHEQKRADAASTRLQAELTTSSIERGRLLGRTGNLTAAEELIWREHLVNPASNHSFWALWELYSHNPCLATLGMHDRTMRAVAYAPDGRLFASAGDDAVVKLWDTSTFECAAILTQHTGPVRGLDFGPDGRHLASASLDGTIVIWDVASHTPVQVLRGHAGAFHSVCYSRDGTQLVCGADDGTVRVLDAAQGKTIGTLPGHQAAVVFLRFSPDAALLATASTDRMIKLWRDLSGPAIATLTGHRGGVASLAFSPDGHTLASGGSDKAFKLWDLATYECTDTIDANNGTVRFLKFSSDGQSLIVCGWWRIDVWDLSTRTRRPLAAHGVEAADVSPNGRFLAHAGGYARVWPSSVVRLEDIATDAGVLRLSGSSGRRPAAVGPGGRLIAASDAAGRVCLWETATGRLLASLEGHPNRWSSCHFHPAGRILATCTSGEMKFWDLATGGMLCALSGHHAATTHSMTFSPDGNTFAATWQDGTIQIRAMSSNEIITTIPARQHETLSVRFSPDGNTLAATYRWGMIRWYSARGDLLAEFNTVLTPWTATFSPDGKKLAAACWSREIQIWDLATQTLEQRLEASAAVIWEVAYMPGHPHLLAACSDDGYVQLWDLRQGRNVLTFGCFDGAAVSVSFTPDGKTLVAAGDSTGQVHAWDLEYYERHMAGNMRFYVELLGPELGDAIQTHALTAWADEVLRRPWPRIGPHAERLADQPPATTGGIDVDPDVIAAWGRAASGETTRSSRQIAP
ncbi:MAG: serine/threonine protein kinase [Planctomycetes bacterium]|nr:serine/threonine protein kinase [Planctomycetota bacterium]